MSRLLCQGASQGLRLLSASPSLSCTATVSSTIQTAPDTMSQPVEGAQCPLIERQAEGPTNDQRQRLRPFDAMPGPRGHMIVGTLWDYMKKDGFRFNKMFKAMQNRALEYGPVYREKIANRTAVVVSDPVEYAKVIRVDGKYPHRVEMEPLAYYRRSRSLTLGTVSSQGEEWHRHRSSLNKKMLRPKEVVTYFGAMAQVADDFIRHLKRLQNEDGTVPEMELQFFRWAFESIGMVLFEDRIGCLQEPPDADTKAYLQHLIGFFNLLQPLMYNVPVYKLFPTPTWRRYRRHADELLRIGQKFVDKRVEALRSAGDGGDYEAMLTYLLTQESLSPEEVNSHAIDMMTGGVETTSNATLWTLLCLAQAPAVQDTLHAELSEVLPGREAITASQLARLPYLKACLKETFRLYPITFATSRIIAKDLELGGFHVPAGTHVQANLYGMGHDPKLFDDPEEYRPERWLRGTEDSSIKAFTNLPWGHGARMCIGRRIAEQEIYIAVAKLVQHFKVRLLAPVPEPVLKTVMTPDRPARLAFVPRQN